MNNLYECYICKNVYKNDGRTEEEKIDEMLDTFIVKNGEETVDVCEDCYHRHISEILKINTKRNKKHF